MSLQEKAKEETPVCLLCLQPFLMAGSSESKVK